MRSQHPDSTVGTMSVVQLRQRQHWLWFGSVSVHETVVLTIGFSLVKVGERSVFFDVKKNKSVCKILQTFHA